MSEFSIATERLVLRDWREADVEPFIRHTNTPAVMRWLGGVRPDTDLSDMILRVFQDWQRERGFTFWAVERREDCALLGFCGLKLASDEGTKIKGLHEIGWRLRQDAWGRGYAREAATASLDFAFGPEGAERVVALTVIGNEASWRLMERLGMTRRPDLDYEGPDWAETPVIVYEIRREEWKARSS